MPNNEIDTIVFEKEESDKKDAQEDAPETSDQSEIEEEIIIEYIEDDEEESEETLWQSFFSGSSEVKVGIAFFLTLLALFGLIIYISKTKEPRDVSLNNEGGLPEINVGNILGADSAQQRAQAQNQAQQAVPQIPQPTSDLIPITQGKITLESSIQPNETIQTYNEDYLLSGNLGLQGDIFTFVVFVNDKEWTTYGVAPDPKGRGISVSYGGNTEVITEKDHDYSNFLLNIEGLPLGESTIKLSLFSEPAKTNSIDEFSFIINRSEIVEEINVDTSTTSDFDKERFFTDIGADVTGDSLWLGIPPIASKNSSINAESLFGENEEIKNYTIKEVGQVEIEGAGHPVYSLGFTTHSEDLSYINGYIKEGVFYYFSNATKVNSVNDDMFMYYARASKYKLENTVLEISNISLDDSDNSFTSSTEPFICEDDISNIDEIYEYEGIQISEDFVGYDVFGQCRDFSYDAEYFKDEKFNGLGDINVDHKNDFHKLDIELDEEEISDEFYTIYTYTCENKNVRKLPDSYEDYLDEIGKTSSGEDVFILEDDAPKFNEPLESGLIKFSDAKDKSDVSDDEWEDYIKDQKTDYPLIFVESEFDGYLSFVHKDYVYIEDCK